MITFVFGVVVGFVATVVINGIVHHYSILK